MNFQKLNSHFVNELFYLWPYGMKWDVSAGRTQRGLGNRVLTACKVQFSKWLEAWPALLGSGNCGSKEDHALKNLKKQRGVIEREWSKIEWSQSTQQIRFSPIRSTKCAQGCGWLVPLTDNVWGIQRATRNLLIPSPQSGKQMLHFLLTNGCQTRGPFTAYPWGEQHRKITVHFFSLYP